jgi:hypothetical protein
LRTPWYVLQTVLTLCNFLLCSLILWKELKEIDRWVELYETHDKYTFVGHLVDNPVDDILDSVEEESVESEVEETNTAEEINS